MYLLLKCISILIIALAQMFTSLRSGFEGINLTRGSRLPSAVPVASADGRGSLYFSSAWMDLTWWWDADAFAPSRQKPQNTDNVMWGRGLRLGAIPPGLMVVGIGKPGVANTPG